MSSRHFDFETFDQSDEKHDLINKKTMTKKKTNGNPREVVKLLTFLTVENLKADVI